MRARIAESMPDEEALLPNYKRKETSTFIYSRRTHVKINISHVAHPRCLEPEIKQQLPPRDSSFCLLSFLSVFHHPFLVNVNANAGNTTKYCPRLITESCHAYSFNASNFILSLSLSLSAHGTNVSGRGETCSIVSYRSARDRK